MNTFLLIPLLSVLIAGQLGAVAPKARVTVGVSSLGGGFKTFINHEVDMSDAARSIKMSDIDKAVAAGIEFIELPVAYDIENADK